MRRLVLLLLLPLLSTVLASAADEAFVKLLNEAGLEYEIPSGYKKKPVEYNDVLPYQYRVVSDDGAVEIRYTIFPLDRVKIDYDDPHSSAPEPDHLFTLLFPSVLTDISGWGHYKSKDYPASEALRLFRADWAAVAVLDVIPKYSREYKHALVVAIHRNGHADAYQIFLSNDIHKAGEAAKKTESSLRFKK